MVLSWTDKRNIFMLSTKHSNEMIDVPTRLVYISCSIYNQSNNHTTELNYYILNYK